MESKFYGEVIGVKMDPSRISGRSRVVEIRFTGDSPYGNCIQLTGDGMDKRFPLGSRVLITVELASKL